MPKKPIYDKNHKGFKIRKIGVSHFVIVGRPADMYGPKSFKTLDAAKRTINAWEKRQYRKDKVKF